MPGLVKVTCCARTWAGPDRAHCCHRYHGCGHVFDNPTLFDTHRPHGDCLDPQQLGLTQTKNGIWTR